jgi:hypothetical protein
VFTLTWALPGILFGNSIVEIWLPFNQITVVSGTASYTNGGSTTLTFTYLSASTTHTKISINQWLTASSTNVASGVSFRVVITAVNNPYQSATTSDDFVIYHKTKAGSSYSTSSLPIFQTASPLLATPALTFGVISPITIAHTNVYTQ